MSPPTTSRPRPLPSSPATERALRARVATAREMLVASTESDLLTRVCRRVVEEGGYAFASVALPAEGERRIRVGAAWEEGSGELDADAVLDLEGAVLSPARAVLSRGRACVVADIGAEGAFPEWRGAARGLGFTAAASLPLRVPKALVLGALTLCSRQGLAFEPEEVNQLSALAGDLARALARLRRLADERWAFEETSRTAEMYRGVFENTGTGTIIIDPDMLILFANAKFADLCGYRKEELEGLMRWSQFVHPDDLAMMQRYHYGRRKGVPDVPTEYECRIVDRRGAVQHMFMKVGMIPGTSRSIASFMDITERKRAEEGLREREALYRGVFENTGTGTILIDPDMLILFTNATFAELCGYAVEEIVGLMRWSQFVHPADLAMMQRYHYGRRRGTPGVPTEYECRIVARSGAVKYIYMKVGMIPGTSRSIASFLDITERRVAEEGLRESEAKLSSIIESFEGLIYISTPDHRLEFMSRPLIERAGRDAVGETCHRVVHGLDAPCPWCSTSRVLGGERVRGECRSPGDGRWYLEMRSPIRDVTGSVERIETILLDITERKAAEDALAASAEDLRSENLRLKSAIGERYRFGAIVGKSLAMQEVYELILRAAASDSPVIVQGESGTGKELVARAIHDLSPRAKEAFVPVNCGAVSESLAESEFFGHRKGAFTGAGADRAGYLDGADRGTLFLDEVGEISPAMQVKLLRAIEGGGYTPVGGQGVRRPDVRVVAATNRDLKSLVEQGLMREDFFYRIHVIPIRLPPLRERKEDLSLLIDHFLFSHGGSRPPITAEVLEAFQRYDWPGNVRELENVLKRYLTLHRLDFPELAGRPAPQEPPAPVPAAGQTLEERIDEVERAILEAALREQRWHRERTAAALGIHRKTLFTKLRKHGLL